jgi:hypothetical protein
VLPLAALAALGSADVEVDCEVVEDCEAGEMDVDDAEGDVGAVGVVGVLGAVDGVGGANGWAVDAEASTNSSPSESSPRPTARRMRRNGSRERQVSRGL